MRRIIFTSCCLFVAAVSVYDAMLVILHRGLIHDFERNPFGRWIIEGQGGDVWLFVLTKLAGTALVCTVLVTLYECHARLALVVSGGLACFQTILFWYLTFR